MLNKLKEEGDCFKSQTKDTEIALCGNNVVEPGEECDCGMDEYSCHDPCCYPAKVSLADKEDDISSISCMKHQRPRCVVPPPLVFGIYLPFVVIGLGSLLIGFFLRRDWKSDKKMFYHITNGNVRIVRPTS